jgi:serine/threonine protein kinase
MQPTTAVKPSGPFPQEFGRYSLREWLGGGGMGTVYLAFDRQLEIEVALKIPHAHLMEDPVARAQFYHEARAAARLDHPRFCRVLDVGAIGDTHFLAMRYIPGRPLSRCPPRDSGAAAELVHTLAVALAEAHRLGVIHRDLKPSNILITPEGTPMITDFGLALRLDTRDAQLPQRGDIHGTLKYMAPEQIDIGSAAIGPACDIYALGVVLYELLAGQPPFVDPDASALMGQIVFDPPPPLRTKRSKISPTLEGICLKALAKSAGERFTTMDEFAAALVDYLVGSEPPRDQDLPEHEEPLPTLGPRPLIRREVIRLTFVGYGEAAPPGRPLDRLFLDVGNDLRPGVIDHHHLPAATESTAGLVLKRPECLDGVVQLDRSPDAPFFLVFHENPDLDCVVSAWLAISYLTTRAFPAGTVELIRYVDRIDDGALGMSLAQPCSLYAAYQCLVDRLTRQKWNSNHERWKQTVEDGLTVVEFVADQAAKQGKAAKDIDAFACPELFGREDRTAVLADGERYQRKLSDPRTGARRACLQLPGQLRGAVTAEALLVRDVQNADDPDRCVFFKDWARSDTRRCPTGPGFVALSVFQSEGPRQVRRCILSVTPASGASLRGLATLLDQAEAERRREVFGLDDRTCDPRTGTPLPPRPGFTNADPWYDGRAHQYTIVDAPRSGTLLTAEEIEAILLRFGGNAVAVPLPASPNA